ncbi:MAG TPA: 2OG-Fe(II) oxygenase [Allosphingosinicella sp.]
MIFDRPDAFSGDECDRIIALGEGGDPRPAPVYGRTGEEAVDTAVRDVITSYRARSDETAWLYARLDALFAEAGVALGSPVGPIAEDVQILRYGPGCHFGLWHSDAGFDVQGARILSVSVELSEPGDYDGGMLEIVPETVGRARTLPRGGARFFPSRALHRVTPVTRGVRHALVIWTGAAG